MADYGLRVKDAAGNILLSFTDKITRFIWKSAQTSSSGNSGSLDEIDGLLTGDFCLPVNCDSNKTTHSVSRSSNTISWSTYSPFAALSPATCVVFCFAYT
jgi:hypothetical protein